MDDSLEKVRRDIQETRYALGEKIEKLGDKIETTKNTTLKPDLLSESVPLADTRSDHTPELRFRAFAEI